MTLSSKTSQSNKEPLVSDAASEVTLLADNASTCSKTETLKGDARNYGTKLLSHFKNLGSGGVAHSTTTASASKPPPAPHSSKADPYKNWEARHAAMRFR